MLSNFETEKTRWKSFLKKKKISQKEAALLMGYTNPTQLVETIAKAKHRDFPDALTKLMNFVEGYELHLTMAAPIPVGSKVKILKGQYKDRLAFISQYQDDKCLINNGMGQYLPNKNGSLEWNPNDLEFISKE